MRFTPTRMTGASAGSGSGARPSGTSITQQTIYTAANAYSSSTFERVHSFSGNGVLWLIRDNFDDMDFFNTAASNSPQYTHDYTTLSVDVGQVTGIYNQEGQPPGFATVTVHNSSGRLYLQPFSGVLTNNYVTTSYTGISGTGVFDQSEGPSRGNDEMWVKVTGGSLLHLSNFNLTLHTVTETAVTLSGSHALQRLVKRGGIVGNRVYMQTKVGSTWHLGWTGSSGTVTSLRNWNPATGTMSPAILGVDGAIHVQSGDTPAVIEKIDPTSGSVLASCNLGDSHSSGDITSLATDRYSFLWVQTGLKVYCIDMYTYTLRASASISGTAFIIPPEGYGGIGGGVAALHNSGSGFLNVQRFYLT